MKQREGNLISKNHFSKLSFLFLGFLAVRTTAHAAEAVDLAYEVRSTMGELKSEKSPSLFTAGIKSQNSLGNLDQVGQYIRTREEVFFGIRTKEGWGFLVSDGYSYSNHHHSQDLGSSPGSPGAIQQSQKRHVTTTSTGGGAASNQNIDEQLSLVDPSGLQDLGFQFFHPITNDDSTNLSGMLRASVPTTERTQSTNSFNYGYNLIFSERLPRQWNFSTVISLTYLSRNDYTVPLDTKYGGGLINSFNKRLNPWFKLGVGDRIGVTEHTERPYGTSAEVFTTADFLVTPSIFMGPRIHFPLYSEGPTYSDIPVDPAIKNISAEFFMQIAL